MRLSRKGFGFVDQKKMKVGLLGLGVIGRQHLVSYGTLPGVEVVTRTSPAFDALPPDNRALCRVMLEDPTIDALDLCLPTALHGPLTLAALEAGKHVICEKPMALDVADCAAMVQASEGSRGILMIAQVLRFWPAYQFLREVVASRAYGAIRSLTMTRKSGLPVWAPWLLRREESGGAILDMLVHDFDQALLLFGKPESVTARTVGSANVLESTLHYPGGVEVRIAGGWHDGEVPFGMGFSLESSEGALRYEGGVLTGPLGVIALAAVDPYAVQLGYFLDCCRSGAAPVLCPPASSALAVELACSARELAGA
jgi:predicted dehydrogenase